jgi:hypothetical protein
MSHKKLARNALCPCGSGKKYGHCCWKKGFEWVEDEAGNVFESTPISREVEEVLHRLRQAFIALHGREPGPDDLLFPDLPHPEHLEALVVEDLKAAGVDPAVIYAFEQTGLLVTAENRDLIPDQDLAEWEAAVEEYEESHGSVKGQKAKARHPFGVVALYGPDDRTTTKIAAAVFLRPGAEPIMRRWVASDVTTNPKVRKELQAFFAKHGVKSVAVTEGHLGCPHEEGLDFPHGEDCPFCPFWKGKQGSQRRR